MKRFTTLFALLALMATGIPSIAWAEEPGETPPAGDGDSAATPPPATPDPADGAGDLGGDDDIEVLDPSKMKVDPSQEHWGKNRRLIKVIEPRPFRKDTRHEFTLFFGIVPNDDFFLYMPVGLRWNYFFAEDFSMEVWGLYDITIQSSLKDFLEEKTKNAVLVEIPQTLVTMAGIDVTWSPLHGKLAMFGDTVSTFDFHIAFGAGFIGSEVVDAQTKQTSFKADVSGNLGLGVRMHLSEMLSFRVDYRQYFYPSEAGGLAYPMEFTVGVSLWTDAPQ